MPAASAVHARVNAANVFDDPFIDPGLKLQTLPTGMPLVTHLAHHTVLLLRRHQQLALFKRVSKRLLDVGMNS